jgi:hypothetical protein
MRFVFALSFCLAALAAPSQPAASPSAEARRLLAGAPIRFEAIERPDHRQEWTAHGPGFEYRFFDQTIAVRVGDRFARIAFEGAQPVRQFEAYDPTPSKVQYFIGTSRSERPGFFHLRQKNVYPGIDVVYYGRGQDLEYDFEVAPGADPSRIRLRFPGADDFRINANGEVLLTLGTQKLGQRAPVVYQRRSANEVVAVESQYTIHPDGAVRLKLGDYNPAEKLIVDPVIAYTAYLSGSNNETPVSCIVDAQGMVYIGGSTRSTDLPLSSNPNNYQIVQGGTQDAFVVKLNPNASSADQVFVYGTYFGGGADETLRGLAVDAKGLLYLTGTTSSSSSNFPLSSGAFQSTVSVNKHVFVSVIDPSQAPASALVYSTFLGGTNFEEPYGIAVAKGKVFVTGYTTSDDFPVGNAYQVARVGGYDAFVTEIDPTQSGFASLIGSTFFGGSGQDIARAITVDSAGFVYIAGVTYSGDLPVTGNAYQRFYQGVGDAFIAKIDMTAAQLLYCSYFGTGDTEEAKKILVEPSGRVAIAGYTVSSAFPVTPNALQPVFGGGSDAFLSIFDLTQPGPQQLAYSTYFGGSDAEVAYEMKRDASGKYYLGGYTLSKDLPITGDALNPGSDFGGVDGFVAVINPAAPLGKGLAYSSYYTSGGNQIVYALDVDSKGNIYVTGVATANVFPAGFAAHTSGFGNQDLFFSVVSPSAPGS